MLMPVSRSFFLGGRYSHGFLFPSEVGRVREGVLRDLERLAQQAARAEVSSPSTAATYAAALGHSVTPPEKWATSTVSKFHVRYSPPVSDVNLDYSVEALVEGSDMSMVHDGTSSLQCAARSDTR